ncbi:MAG: hypothetical protein LCI00_16090 [Chloroflexi bacterium]|nr:hypothetical protein [Chloroflexota bacterium]MCC6892752.1 hypothetical protein [Anaerolineae bacterium]
MNSNRGPIIALVIAIGVAIFALIQQQQAVNDLRAAVTNAAKAESARVTAVSMMQEAAGTQVQAEIGQATALAAAGEASTAQATAQAAAGTAAVQIGDIGTRSADTLATSSADVANAQATSTAQAGILSTIQAEATAEVAALQEQVDTAATSQADTLNQLGTATAQVDLAEFARDAAEEDRSSALAQLWDISTAQAEMRGALATAQVMLTSAPPTRVPSSTVPPQPTESAGDSTPVASTRSDLPNIFTSTDDRITVNYPEDWFAQEFRNGTVIIVNQEELFNRTEAALEAGQVEVDVIVGTYEDYGLTELTDPEVLLTEIVTNIQSRQNTFAADSVQALTVNDHPAARVFANDGDNDLTIYTIQLSDNALSVVYGLAAAGEGQDSVDTIFDIVSSITFTE